MIAAICAATFGLSGLAGLSYSRAVTLSCLATVVLGLLVERWRGHRPSLPSLAPVTNELVIVGGSAFLGALVSTFAARGLGADFVLPVWGYPLAALLVPWLFFVAGLVGFNPIVTGALVGGVLAPIWPQGATLGLALAMVCGWGVTIAGTPYSANALLLERLTGYPARVGALRWNWPLSAVALLVAGGLGALLTLLALLLAAGVIILGAWTRLSDAGLGCPDWPGCYGHLDVRKAIEHVNTTNETLPGSLREAHKTVPEMVHRYFASTLGLVILIIAALSFINRKQEKQPLKLPLFLVVLVIFQGILGMWTVTWLLKPAVVTAHLLGGMTTLALLAWLRLSVRRPAPTQLPSPTPGLRRFAGIALALVAVQIALGGWTSTNYAALACPDFPTCQLQWWPDTDVGEAFTIWRGLGVNYEFGVLDNRQRVTIHLFHRVGALIVTAALLGLAWLLWRQRWRAHALAVSAALALQIGIGIGIVKLQLPLGLATAHNAGAALLLLVLVALNHRTRQPALT